MCRVMSRWPELRQNAGEMICFLKKIDILLNKNKEVINTPFSIADFLRNSYQQAFISVVASQDLCQCESACMKLFWAIYT